MREKPPLFIVLLDEGILYRQVGTKEIMRKQLLALIEAAQRPRITIHVVPIEAQALLGLGGAFVIASLSGESDYVYVDGISEGYVTDRDCDVEVVANMYESIRSLALPMPASLDLIAKVVEDKWTET